MLIKEGVTPVVVFDGRPLPAKELTNSSRRKIRSTHKQLARDAEADGRHRDAYAHYKQSVAVTPEMVFELISELKRAEIEYMVSPYESDAQLAYLSLTNYVDVVLTEDGDSLVYGCRRVCFKFDWDGTGQEIRRRSLGANQTLSFLNWTDEMFKLMCCIAGCDYVKKIRNIGLVTAHKFVGKYKTFSKVAQALKASKYEGVDDEYVAKLRNALYTFKHQTIYNPSEKRMQYLTPLDLQAASLQDKTFLGTILDPDVSQRIAVGEVHPCTLKPFDVDKRNVISEKGMKDEGHIQWMPGCHDRESESCLATSSRTPLCPANTSPEPTRRDTVCDEVWKFKDSDASSNSAPRLHKLQTQPANPSDIRDSRKRSIEEFSVEPASPISQLENILKQSQQRKHEGYAPLPINMLHRRKKRLVDKNLGSVDRCGMHLETTNPHADVGCDAHLEDGRDSSFCHQDFAREEVLSVGGFSPVHERLSVYQSNTKSRNDGASDMLLCEQRSEPFIESPLFHTTEKTYAPVVHRRSELLGEGNDHLSSLGSIANEKYLTSSNVYPVLDHSEDSHSVKLRYPWRAPTAYIDDHKESDSASGFLGLDCDVKAGIIRYQPKYGSIYRSPKGTSSMRVFHKLLGLSSE